MTSTDVESLVSTLRHRNKCVYVCLTCLTVALVATSLCGAAVFALLWGNVQKQISSLKPPQTMSMSLSSSPEADRFKSGHLAYLRATQVEAKHNHTMIWEAIPYGSSSSVGSNFQYDQPKGMLTVKSAGSYFVYINLRFTPTDTSCARNRINVTLKSAGEPLLSCVVELPDCQVHYAPVTKKCWDVVRHLQENSQLSADMHGTKDELYGWKLVSNDSGLGIFLVDSS
ncbi:hypothetical protein ACEWY4_017427 [Coilia grayii]|uniref:THD domain-containing protein n=1 Tax=Coilia grayii TaxID=363190 RepID=A0ABD1JGU0_9TELE